MSLHFLISFFLIWSSSALVLVDNATEIHETPLDDVSAVAEARSPVQRSPYMTMKACQDVLKRGRRDVTKPLFWAGCMAEATAACNTASSPKAKYPQLKGFHTIAQILPADALSKYTALFANESAQIQQEANAAFWGSCSQALATLAGPSVYVMLPNAVNVLNPNTNKLDWTRTGIRPGSTVELHEYPRLCLNGRVQQFYHISSVKNKWSEDLGAKIKQDRRNCPKPANIPV